MIARPFTISEGESGCDRMQITWRAERLVTLSTLLPVIHRNTASTQAERTTRAP